MTKFSILIANYNNVRYFKDCYHSLISQTYNNWEAVIVDDGSTDDSVNIIKDMIKNDSRFLFYENSENKGCGFTKRKCVENATGAICGFLDPDDALYPDALKKSVEEYSPNSSIVATYSKMMVCDENLKPQNMFCNTKEIYNDKYFFNCPVQFSHFFTFKRETYLKTSGINPDLRCAVDQDLYLKILELGNVKFIRKTLYKYRLHSNGISQEDSKQMAKESFAYVIYEAMNRRNIKTINSMEVPSIYKNSDEIYLLINYQIGLLYRLVTNIKMLFRNYVKP